jgi:outer membrane protein OmpA-like peptidoglycan-associated protein
MLAEPSTASARIYPRPLGFGLSLVLSLVLAFVLLTATGTSARAQHNTVVVGGHGGGVTVDLSVLDQFGRAANGTDELRFPGARLGPNDAVRLHRPGAKPQLKRPTKKRARRKPKKRAVAKAKRTPRATTKAVPKPQPKRAAKPRIATAPPKPVTAPPRTPKMTRSTVPPPPPPAQPQAQLQAQLPTIAKAAPKAVVKTTPDVPPVVPAPRTSIAASNLKAPSPPPAPPKIPKQTASRPAAPEKTGGAISAGTTRMIAFGAGITAVPAGAESTLKAAAKALKGNQGLRVQLKAYAASGKDGESRARRLSLTRALGVRSFLIKQGVQPTRIDVRALGSKVPSGSPDRVDLSVVAR